LMLIGCGGWLRGLLQQDGMELLDIQWVQGDVQSDWAKYWKLEDEMCVGL